MLTLISTPSIVPSGPSPATSSRRPLASVNSRIGEKPSCISTRLTPRATSVAVPYMGSLEHCGNVWSIGGEPGDDVAEDDGAVFAVAVAAVGGDAAGEFHARRDPVRRQGFGGLRH